MDITKELFKLQDNEYKKFQSNLTPNIDINNIIGIRVPILREFSKTINDNDKLLFLNSLPHKYYDENMLHSILLTNYKNYSECINYVDKYLPYITNWAECDTLRPKCFKKNRADLLNYINKWLKSDKTYVIRYAIGTLMSEFLDNDFKEEYLYKVSSIRSSEYYINMMISWYFATALAKQWDYTIKILENNSLDKWCHNKTIQKAVESYRITIKQKEYLKSLRRK